MGGHDGSANFNLVPGYDVYLRSYRMGQGSPISSPDGTFNHYAAPLAFVEPSYLIFAGGRLAGTTVATWTAETWVLDFDAEEPKWMSKARMNVAMGYFGLLDGGANDAYSFGGLTNGAVVNWCCRPTNATSFREFHCHLFPANI
jgi:hypothetical protein